MRGKRLGYRCKSCGAESDMRRDWIISEINVRCRKCGSSNVEPIDIERGVFLKPGFRRMRTAVRRKR